MKLKYSCWFLWFRDNWFFELFLLHLLQLYCYYSLLKCELSLWSIQYLYSSCSFQCRSLYIFCSKPNHKFFSCTLYFCFSSSIHLFSTDIWHKFFSIPVSYCAIISSLFAIWVFYINSNFTKFSMSSLRNTTSDWIWSLSFCKCKYCVVVYVSMY